jgi:HTH-type transcriptional regulator/antitoxin HigA
MSTVDIEKVTEAWPPISGAVRVPHTNEEYKDLVELLDYLTDDVGEDENHPLASLMDVVGVLIEKYEDEHVPILKSGTKAKFAYPVKRNSGSALGREKSAAYRKKKRATRS